MNAQHMMWRAISILAVATTSGAAFGNNGLAKRFPNHAGHTNQDKVRAGWPDLIFGHTNQDRVPPPGVPTLAPPDDWIDPFADPEGITDLFEPRFDQPMAPPGNFGGDTLQIERRAVPAPGGLSLLLLAFAGRRRRRRSTG